MENIIPWINKGNGWYYSMDQWRRRRILFHGPMKEMEDIILWTNEGDGGYCSSWKDNLLKNGHRIISISNVIHNTYVFSIIYKLVRNTYVLCNVYCSFWRVNFPKTKLISKKHSSKFQVGKFPESCTIMSLSLYMNQFLGFTHLEILLKSMGRDVPGCVCTEDFLVHGLEG